MPPLLVLKWIMVVAGVILAVSLFVDGSILLGVLFVLLTAAFLREALREQRARS
ncbi:hypothetical protein [Patulibacter sp.]|uniref:hypothetical protein n=1 Tax=Patulibacter sp. TaxID=1912859 RepID=UPI00271E81EB|nr:hypothetical protein [Patulibacter sp.]MDO9409174.1 hypothetical protein [Patulibacter sp.]